MEFELKAISPDSVEAAKQKAVRYRLLNEPALAESICRDVLTVAPGDREAVITLLLSLTDQFTSPRGSRVSEATALVETLEDEYDRIYYAGMVCERRGLASLTKAGPGSGPIAYDWLRRAMGHYQNADEVGPDGNEEALLRWNTCARVIMRDAQIRPLPDEPSPTMLE
jgi:hypothetical protein